MPDAGVALAVRAAPLRLSRRTVIGFMPPQPVVYESAIDVAPVAVALIGCAVAGHAGTSDSSCSRSVIALVALGTGNNAHCWHPTVAPARRATTAYRALPSAATAPSACCGVISSMVCDALVWPNV